MKNFKVEFKVGSSHSSRTLTLQGGSESEAIEKLVSQGTVRREQRSEIVILSVKPT